MDSHSHQHSHDHHHHIGSKTKLVMTIFLNIAITISEFIGGVLSGSLALISDAGHNLSDVLSLMLGYAGEKVSEKEPDAKFSFGLKRFEVLIALINAISLIAIGIYIVVESVERIQNPTEINITIMIPVAVIGLLGNLFSILLLVKNRDDSLNMKAAFLHLFYDTVSSVAVIIAAVIVFFTQLYIIDVIISILIVFMIFWSAVGIIRESIFIFLQRTPSHIDADDVYGRILSLTDIASIHGLHIWSISSKEVFLSAHICIDENKKTNTDSLISEINNILESEYNITHTTLQIEHTQICSLNDGICCR